MRELCRAAHGVTSPAVAALRAANYSAQDSAISGDLLPSWPWVTATSQ
ncbi:hypothetical protein ACFV4Q_18070 [Streptomyces nojiriensis]